VCDLETSRIGAPYIHDSSNLRVKNVIKQGDNFLPWNCKFALDHEVWDEIPSCIPDGHPCRVTNTRCRIDTIISPDDEHIVARNTQRIEINIQEKMCTRLVLFTRPETKYSCKAT
jgi:hypothetical protein